MFIYFYPPYVALCASKAWQRFGSEKLSWCLETFLFLRLSSRDGNPSLPLLSPFLSFILFPTYFPRVGFFSGCLMSSGSIHKLYCGIYSTFKCSFDEIVWGGKSSPRPTPQQSWLLSCGVWREHAGLLSRPCRKRRPSSRDVGGVSWFFWSCGASVGFLTRYDRELREPLVWCQGSQVSIRVARGRTSLLSSHGSGIRAQRNEKGRLRSFSGCGRKPWVPSTCACDLR